MRQVHSALAAGIASMLLGGVLSAAPAEAAPADQRPAAHQRYAKAAFKATNNRREAHDRRALRRNDCIQKWARRNAKRMARRQVMDHQQIGPIMRDCGRGAGENIAYGYPTGRAVVRAWMHSDGHRANILNRGYRVMGIAARRGNNGRWYVAQVFGGPRF
jgi:uncharacterized protein YkwD